MTASAERTLPGAAQQGRIPDFFIVGHAKCGTTALYEMLRRHPQIYMPDYKAGAGKEPWYFSRDNPQPQTTGVRDIAFTGRTAMSMDEYLSLFADAQPDQLVGEASTSYLWSQSAAARIATVRPDARIIAIIREPASFLRSLHLQLLENRHETEKDFRRAVELDGPRRENRMIPANSYWPGALIYSDRVRYVEQLRRYHAEFPREQVLVLFYDDFRADNEATVRRVLRFLAADDSVAVEPTTVNPTIALRSERLAESARALRRGEGPLTRALRGAGTMLTSSRMRERLYYPLQRRALYSPPPPPDEEFMQELRRRFKPEVVALSNYVDRDLEALWGYDHLD
jgi:hypothetical protein